MSAPLHTLALAALARHLTPGDAARPEALALTRAAETLADPSSLPWPEQVLATLDGPPSPPWHERLLATLTDPTPPDAALVAAARSLDLTPIETLTIALAALVEEDPLAARAVAFLQAPAGGLRPTLGLCAVAFAELVPPGSSPLHALVTGTAISSGFLLRADEGSPLAEQALSLPSPVYLALRGLDPMVAGTVELGAMPVVPLPPSITTEIDTHAHALAGTNEGLVLRSAGTTEARTVAVELARRLGRRAFFVDTEPCAFLAPLLALRELLPVFCHQLAPGERRQLPRLRGYTGPVLVVCGPDGSVERPEGRMLSWTLPVPSPAERLALWETAIGTGELATDLARTHRHRAGRISDLTRLAHHHARMHARDTIEADDVMAAAWASEGGDLGALAQPLSEPIGDEVLVLGEELREELRMLHLRCLCRDGLSEGLGPSAAARYRPGLKALFVGPSGNGKTLAAGWLTTRLGMPLYRVDLAGVTSKYIGETEKNLAQLFARAEHADIALLFDEADAMFGKRTDIKEANDRFANAQTNYLLQRIETFDGIAILTSNSKARFDPAFLRRLDAILEFNPPTPEDRRRLWLAHLGEGHQLSAREINRLAGASDLSGGHVRNVVLLAAALARGARRPIEWPDILKGLMAEHKKLGRTVPSELLRGSG